MMTEESEICNDKWHVETIFLANKTYDFWSIRTEDSIKPRLYTVRQILQYPFQLDINVIPKNNAKTFRQKFLMKWHGRNKILICDIYSLFHVMQISNILISNVPYILSIGSPPYLKWFRSCCTNFR